METKRQLHVLDTDLANHEYLAGDAYTIKHLARWVETISAREPAQRGGIVNLAWGSEEHRVHEAANIGRLRELIKAEGAKEPAV